jgi:hypothetical protein
VTKHTPPRRERRRNYKSKADEATGARMVTALLVDRDLLVSNCPYCGFDHLHGGLANDATASAPIVEGWRVPHCLSGEHKDRQYYLRVDNRLTASWRKTTE